jgi:hypothetical protein
MVDTDSGSQGRNVTHLAAWRYRTKIEPVSANRCVSALGNCRASFIYPGLPSWSLTRQIVSPDRSIGIVNISTKLVDQPIALATAAD